jgi:hypothetical protein
MNRSIALFIGLLVSVGATAHQDTAIKLATDGSLVGLPKEYSPANFNFSNWTISIADKKYVFPTCISTKFSDLGVNQFQINSSWYNPVIVISDFDSYSFPSFIKITVESENFSVLLDLDTVKPFNPLHSEYAVLTTGEVCNLLSAPKRNLIIDSAKKNSQNK